MMTIPTPGTRWKHKDSLETLVMVTEVGEPYYAWGSRFMPSPVTYMFCDSEPLAQVRALSLPTFLDQYQEDA